MKFECEYAGKIGCMCDACKSMRKAIEEAEKISEQEIKSLFLEAEEKFKTIEKGEQ